MKLDKRMSSALVLGALAFVACTDAATVRVGSPAPARPVDCGLELIDVPPGQTPPGLELLGYVRIQHDEGKTPRDPEVLSVLKPEACKLGGEKVSAGTSGNATNGFRSSSYHLYMVWRTKQAGSQAPMKF